MPGSDGILTAALLPVKNPARAKQRLKETLSPEARSALAHAMFRRTLRVLLEAAALDRVVVLSDADEILEAAVRSGAEAWEEREQSSHSESADFAATRLAGEGVGRLLLAPIDVPLLSATEVDAIVAAARELGSPSVVVAVSADGRGTNAVVRTPPDVIPARFGPGSAALHRAEAARAGAACVTHRATGWLHDLDTPDDLARIESLGLDEGIRRLAAEGLT